MKTIGKIFLLVGFLFTILAVFQVATRKLVDIDPQQISNPDIVSIYWSPITAIVLTVAGIMTLFIARKERTFRHH